MNTLSSVSNKSSALQDRFGSQGGVAVTHLRKRMLEELQRRNYSENTTRFYIA